MEAATQPARERSVLHRTFSNLDGLDGPSQDGDVVASGEAVQPVGHESEVPVRDEQPPTDSAHALGVVRSDGRADPLTSIECWPGDPETHGHMLHGLWTRSRMTGAGDRLSRRFDGRCRSGSAVAGDPLAIDALRCGSLLRRAPETRMASWKPMRADSTDSRRQTSA